MRKLSRIAVLAFAVGVCAGALVWQQWHRLWGRAADASAMYGLVERQIWAMHDRNYAAAYSQVSSGVQGAVNIEEFTRLAETDAAELRRAVRIEFGHAVTRGRFVVMAVYLFDRDSRVTPCVFRLTDDGGGAWRIDGIHVGKRWPAGKRLDGVWA